MEPIKWSDLKSLYDDVGGHLRHIESDHEYKILLYDESIVHKCIIDKEDTTDLDDFEDNYKAKSNIRRLSTEYEAQSVHVLKPTEPSTKAVSHRWNDKTTWYQGSTRVTGEALSDSGDGLTFNSANTHWINLANGLIYQEDDISSPYLAKIYVNAVLQTSGYTINYATGDVTFSASKSGQTITADYSYAVSSLWTLEPSSGKMLNIEHTEVQFAGDVKIPNAYHGDSNTTWFDFSIWVYNPADLPNKIQYSNTRYKSEADIISDANLAYPHRQFGNLPGTDEYLTFPFNYGSLQVLRNSVGAELRVSLKDDIPIEGSFANLTVYFLSRDE